MNARASLAVGTMVGTSLDGVDAALVEFVDGEALRPVRMRAFCSQRLQEAPAPRLREIAAGGATTAAELSSLAFALARDHERVVRAVCAQGEVDVAALEWVAVHGVTLAHAPRARGGHGWQLMAPAALAAWLETIVVGDFRCADIALGGEGAPLAPVADRHLRGSGDEDRVVLNLGGIANLTALPAAADDPAAIRAADVGPANLPLDEIVRRATGRADAFDRDGALAASGRADPVVVAAVLDEPWVRAPLPRSFGREEFGPRWVDAFLARTAHLDTPDRLATLVEIEARALAWLLDHGLGGWRRRTDRPLHLLLTGGGRHNAAVHGAIARAIAGARVDGIEVLGEDADAKESVDFALLGGLALRGRRAGASSTTGARRDAILGCISDGRTR